MNLIEFKAEIPHIFKKVKDDVKSVLGKYRIGLRLGLADMGIYRGGFIVGMHFHPGTELVMNKSPLRIILRSHTYEIIWAYGYHILLNLYLKSLGILDELECKQMTLRVSNEIFKEQDHPAIMMAENGIESYFPNLKITYIPPDRRPEGMPIEYITGFDKEIQTYFS